MNVSLIRKYKIDLAILFLLESFLREVPMLLRLLSYDLTEYSNY